MAQEFGRIRDLAERMIPNLEIAIRRSFDDRLPWGLKIFERIRFRSSRLLGGSFRNQLSAINRNLTAAIYSSTDIRFDSRTNLDVAEDVLLMAHQLRTLQMQGRNTAPVVLFGDSWIPELAYDADHRGDEVIIHSLDESAERMGKSPIRRDQAPISKIAEIMARPLAYFFGSRLSAEPERGGAAANVKVFNDEANWQVIYTPIYLSERNGLGGPSSPVVGYVKPGTFYFGISRPNNVIWYPTKWMIPNTSDIYIPVP